MWLVAREYNINGFVKSLIYCVVAVFQELYKYSLVPEKQLRLVYEPFYLAIRRLFKDFYESININSIVSIQNEIQDIL